MSFASCDFDGSDGTTIGTKDANWAQQTGYGSAFVTLLTNRGRGNSTVNTACYHYNSAPPSADYEVGLDLYIVDTSTSTDSGPIARASAAAQTFYMARYKPGTGIQLYKIVSGTTTQLGSTVSATYTAGQTVRLRLRCSGSTIEVYRDAETSPLISVTDTAITSAGFPGFWTKTNTTAGPHIDNWDASELAAPSALTGTLTFGDIVASGTLSSGSPSALSGTLTLGDIVASGSLGPAAGDWAIPALTNWSGGLQTAVTVPVVVFLGLADGSLVLALTDQTTDGSGNLSGSNASLTPGVTYMACGWNADGSARFALPVTAT